MLITPKYIFNTDVIKDSFTNLKKMLSITEIHYALKANAELEILRTLKDINASFEVASIEEFNKLKSIEISSEKIICGLPIKTAEMIRFLYEQGCNYFVFDHLSEYEKICKNAPAPQKKLSEFIYQIYVQVLLNMVCLFWK